jgi:hypothetical protein
MNPLRRADYRATRAAASKINRHPRENGTAISPSRQLAAPLEAPPSAALRPFFGFYGGKWRDALKHYPPPKHSSVVEPFAGSAGYSIRYPARRVILCEIDPILAQIWTYLIGVRAAEILAIPDITIGGTIDDLKVCQEAKWLVGLWLNRGVSNPRLRPSKWMRDGIRPGSFWGCRVRQTIASQLDSIRHWEIHNGSYKDVPAPRTATWFIDPPYQKAGQHYKFGSADIDYNDLALWCKARRGQVMVCENAGADWLPFRRLADVKTTRSERRSMEVLWTNDLALGTRRRSNKGSVEWRIRRGASAQGKTERSSR